MPLIRDGAVVAGWAAFLFNRFLQGHRSELREFLAGWEPDSREPVVAVVQAIEQAAAGYVARREASANGSAEAPVAEAAASSAHEDELSTAGVADLLGVSERRVRQRADELGGRRVGRVWLFERSVVMAVEARKSA